VQLGVQLSVHEASAVAVQSLSQLVCNVAMQAVSTEVVSQCVWQSWSRTNSHFASPVRNTPPQASSLACASVGNSKAPNSTLEASNVCLVFMSQGQCNSRSSPAITEPVRARIDKNLRRGTDPRWRTEQTTSPKAPHPRQDGPDVRAAAGDLVCAASDREARRHQSFHGWRYCGGVFNWRKILRQVSS